MSSLTADALYAGYVDQDGRWLSDALEWLPIRQAPRTRIHRLWDSDGRIRMGRWAEPAGRDAGWYSVIDPTVRLRPRYYRDLVRLPDTLDPPPPPARYWDPLPASHASR